MKTYLGDSVYVQDNGCDYTLTTENGFGPSNTIIIDDEILRALNEFVDRENRAAENAESEDEYVEAIDENGFNMNAVDVDDI